MVKPKEIIGSLLEKSKNALKKSDPACEKVLYFNSTGDEKHGEKSKSKNLEKSKLKSSDKSKRSSGQNRPPRLTRTDPAQVGAEDFLHPSTKVKEGKHAKPDKSSAAVVRLRSSTEKVPSMIMISPLESAEDMGESASTKLTTTAEELTDNSSMSNSGNSKSARLSQNEMKDQSTASESVETRRSMTMSENLGSTRRSTTMANNSKSHHHSPVQTDKSSRLRDRISSARNVTDMFMGHHKPYQGKGLAESQTSIPYTDIEDWGDDPSELFGSSAEIAILD